MNIIKRYKHVVLAAALVTFGYALFQSNDSYAIPYKSYLSQDIFIYNPNGQLCSTQNQATGELSGENVEKVLKFFTGKGLTLVQAAAIAGNLQQESNINPAALNSIGAYGIAQWLNGRRTNLEQKPNYSTIEGQLDFLWEELTGVEKAGLDALLSGPQTPDQISRLAVIFGEVFERYGVGEEGNRGQYAAEIYKAYQGKIQDGDPSTIDAASGGGGGASGTNVSTEGCGGNASGVVSGSIVDTAKNLAWNPATDAGYSDSVAKKEYSDAVAKHNSGTGGSETDCGLFVATVMRSSGADPEYAQIGTADQHRYVQSKPDKYMIIKNPKSSDLQPGDILVNPSDASGYGHTLIYTGDLGNGYVAANASLGDTVPVLIDQGAVEYQLTRPGNILARLIKAPTKA